MLEIIFVNTVWYKKVGMTAEAQKEPPSTKSTFIHHFVMTDIEHVQKDNTK